MYITTFMDGQSREVCFRPIFATYWLFRETPYIELLRADWSTMHFERLRLLFRSKSLQIHQYAKGSVEKLMK